jgi:hypothetical protein
MIKRGTAAIVLIVFSLAFFSCATRPSSFTNWSKADFFGMVYDGEDMPLGGASVEIDGKNAAESDSSGRFVCSDLQKGKHSIAISLKGYGSFAQEITFNNRMDVFYLKMYSAAQFVELSLSENKRGNGKLSREYADKAERIDGNSVQVRFLKASFAYKDSNFEKALEILDLLEKEEYNSASIYLLKADIYQFGMNSPKQAEENLRCFLTLKEDDSIRERLEKLTQNTTLLPKN